MTSHSAATLASKVCHASTFCRDACVHVLEAWRRAHNGDLPSVRDFDVISRPLSDEEVAKEFGSSSPTAEHHRGAASA